MKKFTFAVGPLLGLVSCSFSSSSETTPPLILTDDYAKKTALVASLLTDAMGSSQPTQLKYSQNLTESDDW